MDRARSNCKYVQGCCELVIFAKEFSYFYESLLIGLNCEDKFDSIATDVLKQLH